jgi:hypothetical protein
LCSARFCLVERAHEAVEHICKILSLGAETFWDIYASLPANQRMILLHAIFASMTLTREGVVDYQLKTGWFRAAVECRKRADIPEAFLSLGCALICWRHERLLLWDEHEL